MTTLHLYIIFLFFFGIHICHAQAPEKHLNIVLILADEQGAHLSALNTPGISTPNIDQLAQNGMMFTNAFAVAPSCSPSRSSIMTGMYAHANGHWRNTITPKLDYPGSEFGRNSNTVDEVGIHKYIETLPELLQKNGYFTAITQKFHMISLKVPSWRLRTLFPPSNRPGPKIIPHMREA